MPLKEEVGRSLKRTLAGAIVPAVLLPIFLYLPWHDGAMEAGAVLVVHGLLACTAFLALGRRLREAGGEGRGRASLVDLSLACLCAWSILRVLFQDDPCAGWLRLADYLAFGLFYWLHATEARRRPGWGRGASLWLLAGALLAAGHGLAGQLFLPAGRAGGPFRDPNHLATLINAGAAVALARLLSPGGAAGASRPGGRLRRLAWIFPLLPLAWALTLTGSRGGLLAFFALLLTAVLVFRRRLVLVPLLLLLLLLTVPNPFLDYLRGEIAVDPFAWERLGIWRMSLSMLAAHPLGGAGLGNYHLLAPAFNFPVEQAAARFGRMPAEAHNAFLQLLAEGGLPLLLPFLGLAAAVVLALLRLLRHARQGEADPAAEAVLGIVALGTQAMVSNNLGNNALCFIFLFFLACLGGRGEEIAAAGIGRLEAEGPARPAIRTPFAGFPLPATRRALLLLRWPALALALWAAVWTPYQGDRLARRGRGYLASGDETRALLFLRQATFWVPIHSYYRHEMAAIYGRRFYRTCDLPHFSRAVALNAEARRLNPGEGRFLVFEAALWRRLSQLPGPWVPEAAGGARRLYEEALRLAPHQYQVPAILAEMDRAAGDPRAAVRRLEQALAEEPNFLRGRLMLAELLEELGEEDAARRERQEAAERARRFAGRPPTGGEYERELLALPGAP